MCPGRRACDLPPLFLPILASVVLLHYLTMIQAGILGAGFICASTPWSTFSSRVYDVGQA